MADTKERSLQELIDFIGQDNIAEELEPEELTAIGQQVLEDFNAAIVSMKDWSELVKKGLELVKPATEGRSEPWPGASNFKSPALAELSYRFGERASTELLRPKDLVKAEVIGEDPEETKKDRGDRVSTYMSTQLNHEMPEWRDEERGLLYRISNMGTIFKKTFFDPNKGRLVSDVIQYPSFAVNQNTPSMEELRDFTHILEIKNNDIITFQRSRLWLDEDLALSEDDQSTDEENHDTNNTFLEQQCFYDIDGDGYEEPYTVTVHKSSGKVVRIVARFRMADILVTDGDQQTTVDKLFQPLEDEHGQLDNPDGTQQEGLIDSGKKREIVKITPASNITKRGFLPSSDGTFLDVGYFQILSALVEGVNAGTNMLFNAGTLATLQGGYLAKGMRRKMGDSRFKPGVYKPTNISVQDLQQGIRDHTFKEPSPTLLTLVEGLKKDIIDVSASVDIAELVATNVAASTILMVLEEAQSSTTSLMSDQARGMGKEFQIIYRLNGVFADPQEYQRVLDNPEADYEKDFTQGDLDILPTANPEISNKAMRIQQSQILNEQFDRLVSVGADGRAIMQRFLEDMGIDNIETILPAPTEEFAAQQTRTSQATEQAKIKEAEFFGAQTNALNANARRSEAEAQLKLAEIPQRVKKLAAEVILTLEKAESEDVKNQIAKYTSEFQELQDSISAIGALDDLSANRDVRATAGPPTNGARPGTGAPGIPGQLQ